jgi:hypothetical protein
MPTTSRPSMSALSGRASSIFANPYGGADQNDINEYAAGLETAGGRDARVVHEQQIRNLLEERGRLENNKLSPMRALMDTAATEDYSTGRWNSPQGYNTRQRQDQEYTANWNRKAPEREYGLEALRAPWQGRLGVQEAANRGKVDVAQLQTSSANDIARDRDMANLLVAIIRGQTSQQTEVTKGLAGPYRAGAALGQDPNAMAQGFTNAVAKAPGSAGPISFDRLMRWAQENEMTLAEARAHAIAEGFVPE